MTTTATDGRNSVPVARPLVRPANNIHLVALGTRNDDKLKVGLLYRLVRDNIT